MVDPRTVEYNQTRVLNILYYDQDFSIALLLFEGQKRYGMRWNGSESEQSQGTPTSHGKATWFIVPDRVVETTLKINIK